METTIANPSPVQVIGRASECMRRLMEAGLSFDALQTPIDDPDMRRRLVRSWLSGYDAVPPLVTPNPFFANEEVKSNYGYPQGYAVKPVCEQLVALSKHFPALDTSSVLACSKQLPALPQGAEGWFAIPRFEKVASTYNEAFEKVLDVIGTTRTFHNYRKGQLGEKYLRPSERTAVALQMLGEKQKGDFLLIPAQFGLTHRGRSVRRVRVVYAPHEFGLGAFAVGCMLLSHPERLVQWEQLHVDCSGDEYAPDADGQFDRAPIFNFNDDEVRFHAYWVNSVDGSYGSASGFLPQ